MKEKTTKNFEEVHQQEIQAANNLMEKIKPQLDEMRAQYPGVGIMVQFGIIDSEHHWVNRYCKMKNQLIVELCTSLVHEILEAIRRN